MVNTSLSAPRTTEVGQGIGSPALLDLALITLMWAIASTIANPVLNLWRHFGQVLAVFWIAATLLGAAGAVLLFYTISVHSADQIAKAVKRAGRSSEASASLFLTLCSVAYLLPFISYGFFDRYLILLVPFIGIAIAAAHRPIEHPNKHKGALAVGMSLPVAWSLSPRSSRGITLPGIASDGGC